MRHYLDISHFRAPYKNVAISGYGAIDVPAIPGMPAGLDPNTAAISAATFEKRGARNYWKSAPKDAAIAALERSGIQDMSTPEADVAAVIALTDDTLAIAKANGSPLAIDWYKQKLKEGKAVIAPFWLLMPLTDTSRQLAAVPANDKARLDMAAGTPVAGILGDPSSSSSILKWGLIAGGVVAGAFALGIVGKKAFKSNASRRRPSRAARRLFTLYRRGKLVRHRNGNAQIISATRAAAKEYAAARGLTIKPVKVTSSRPRRRRHRR